jgi:hypothetical protein
VGSFPAVPGFNPSAFWDVVTRDASPAAGAAPDCVDNTREAFRQLFDAGGSAEGRQQLQATFRLCDALEDEAGVLQLAYWAQVRGCWGVCMGQGQGQEPHGVCVGGGGAGEGHGQRVAVLLGVCWGLLVILLFAC